MYRRGEHYRLGNDPNEVVERDSKLHYKTNLLNRAWRAPYTLPEDASLHGTFGHAILPDNSKPIKIQITYDELQ